ncbi:MAG: glycosyltransferase [bacterium]
MPNPLSVLALNYEFPPIGGGGATAHQALLHEMIRDGSCRVLLITSGLASHIEEECIDPFLTIRRIPVGKRDLRYWRRCEVLRYILGAYREAQKALEHNTYDVCHAFFGIPSGLVAYRLRRLLPYVLSLRGSDVPGYNQRFTLDHRLLRPLVRRSWLSAAAVVANSGGLRDLAQQAFDAVSIRVIPNGIDTETFKPQPHPPTQTPRLVTVARLIPRKGIDLLINALSGLTGKPWRLLIVGDGPERIKLEKLAASAGLSSRVEFLGDMDRSRIAQLLPTCDLFVLPSLAEGMSNAALEAMACGLPVVLTDTGGTRELVRENGVVVPCGNIGALRSALDKCLAERDKWPSMGAQSRRIAESFSWSAVADQYRLLLLEAAGKA